MAAGARFAHTNLVARDWRALAQFYVSVFGCEPRGPERDLCGPWLDSLTGLAGATIKGVHLGLPGHGGSGPTLEIFTYDPVAESPPGTPDRVGYGHIAFEVEDVAAALRAVLDHGGARLGGPVRTTVSGAGELEVAYVRDPEGNIVELQHWS